MYSHNYISVPPFVASRGGGTPCRERDCIWDFILGRGLDSLRGGVPVFFLVPKDQADDSWRSQKMGMKNPSHPTLMGPLENL